MAGGALIPPDKDDSALQISANLKFIMPFRQTKEGSDFEKFDTNGDNTLDKSELETAPTVELHNPLLPIIQRTATWGYHEI